LLRLDSVLRMVARAITECDHERVILVDMMPNLKWMISNKNFVKECAKEFKDFEEKVGSEPHKQLEKCGRRIVWGFKRQKGNCSRWKKD